MILSEVDINRRKPPESGKYLVKTVSTGPTAAIRRLEARLFISHESKDERDKYKWDLKNQVVTHWYQIHPNVEYGY